MDIDGGFKKNAYLGKAYLIDSENQKVIVIGQGRFDTKDLILEAEFQDSTMGEHKRTMLVIETQDGYFSPAERFTYTSMFMGRTTYRRKMDTCFHWPANKEVGYFLGKFDELSIQIKAKHDNTVSKRKKSKDSKQETEELTITSVRKDIDSATHKSFTVRAGSGFGSGFSHDRVDDAAIVRQRMRFKITNTDGPLFDIDSFARTLQVFKVYWVSSHDLLDCEFTNIKLGNDISFVMQNNKLAAAAKNVEGYRAAISINTPLQLETFAKLLDFYFNKSNNKQLGSRSKIGLAMNRVVRYRFSEKPIGIEYRVIDLVFALQGFAESVAQNEISKQNKATKAETLKAIERVQATIKSIDSDIPDNVRKFYLKDNGTIYTAISRPTFARSIEVTASKLNVDLSSYKTMLGDIEMARQQVVHSENYDPLFLVDLLTQGTTKIEKSKDGTTVSMTLGIKKGSLDHLYDLNVTLIQKYLESYGSS